MFELMQFDLCNCIMCGVIGYPTLVAVHLRYYVLVAFNVRKFNYGIISVVRVLVPIRQKSWVRFAEATVPYICSVSYSIWDLVILFPKLAIQIVTARPIINPPWLETLIKKSAMKKRKAKINGILYTPSYSSDLQR